MATIEERNARLDELVKATQAWSTVRQKTLNDQVAFAKRVLKGRGINGLNNKTVEAASELLVEEIDTFLTG